MINAKIKIGSEAHEINIPQSYEEMNWGQFKALPDKYTTETELEIVEALTGKSMEGFWNKFSDLNEFLQIQNHCLIAYLNQIDIVSYELFDIIEYKGKAYNIQKNIGDLPVGRYWEARGYVMSYQRQIEKVNEKNQPAIEEWKEGKEEELKGLDETELWKRINKELEIEHVSTSIYNQIHESLFKIYFYQLFSGKDFDSEEAQQMDIDELLCMDVLKWGSFFLNSMILSMSGTIKTLLKPIIHQKKRKRGILKYLLNLGFFRRYSQWRVAT